MKHNKYFYRSVEKKVGEDHFLHDFLPCEFDLEHYKSVKVPYFKKFGFNVSSLYKDVYAAVNGIVSDTYIPTELYYCTIVPFLNNIKIMDAYADKCAYSYLFSQMRQPETVIKKQNGYYFDSNGQWIDFESAVERLVVEGDCIIKPSMPSESGCGKSVLKFNPLVGSNSPTLRKAFCVDLLNRYESNYIVQRVFRQDKSTEIFHPASLNTIRVYTYRNNNKIINLGAQLRFGNGESFVDNACAGGGSCRVDEDGHVDDVIFYNKTVQKKSLATTLGIKNHFIRNFDRALAMIKDAHARLAYLDLCGWDVAIDENGLPVFMELNEFPDCEFIQYAYGPMFGEYTDDLMEKIKDVVTSYKLFFSKYFTNGRFGDIYLCDCNQ